MCCFLREGAANVTASLETISGREIRSPQGPWQVTKQVKLARLKYTPRFQYRTKRLHFHFVSVWARKGRRVSTDQLHASEICLHDSEKSESETPGKGLSGANPSSGTSCQTLQSSCLCELLEDGAGAACLLLATCLAGTVWNRGSLNAEIRLSVSTAWWEALMGEEMWWG